MTPPAHRKMPSVIAIVLASTRTIAGSVNCAMERARAAGSVVIDTGLVRRPSAQVNAGNACKGRSGLGLWLASG